MQYPFRFTSCLVIAAAVGVSNTVWATTPPIQPEPIPPETSSLQTQPAQTQPLQTQPAQTQTKSISPLVVPETAYPTVQPSTSFDLNAQPFVAPPNLEFDLPTEELKLQPLYIQEQPLRLEIKLSSRKVTLYRGSKPIKSYAIAVGRPGWETPLGTYHVRQMFRNPTWIHPLKPGIEIPGGDPENPLGRYWIGFWTNGKNWIGLHGTDNPGSVGRAASHGCIRMFNKDIEDLFQKVSLGTPVKVVK